MEPSDLLIIEILICTKSSAMLLYLTLNNNRLRPLDHIHNSFQSLIEKWFYFLWKSLIPPTIKPLQQN